jgi:ASPIC and UnbV
MFVAQLVRLLNLLIAALCIVASPSWTLAQAAVDAPTAAEEPLALDQTWQKAGAKYDTSRTAILDNVNRVNAEGPFRPDWESLQNYAQMDEVRSGSSVMSQSDLRLHFDLGKVQTLDLLEVKWPTTQKIERFTQVKANQILTIREGSGIVEPAPTRVAK